MNKSRKMILAANWKMNLLIGETKKYMEKFCPLLNNLSSELEVQIYVPYTNIQTALEHSKSAKLKIGAQNCHFENFGAFTGEVSAQMLSSLGVKNVIIGHSERRKYFFETDEIINKKIKRALNFNMFVIFCVGETAQERKDGKEAEAIKSQIVGGFKNIDGKYLKNICIAYEPNWAIGTGKNATGSEAGEMCEKIRGIIEKSYGKEISDSISIVYGGSLNNENAENILSQSNIDGGLIGGASLDPKKFYEIISKTDDMIVKMKGRSRK